VSGSTGKIGRVCVLPEVRGTGLGAALVRAAVARLRTVPGVTLAKLGAQTHAIGFYERLGFVATGPEYPDAGIPHRDMVCPL
jgi:ElaA protein